MYPLTRAAVVALVALAVPAAAPAVAPERCPGDEISTTRAITGEFSTEQQGAYVLVPFDVPAGTTSVRVKYCHDQPESPTNTQVRHTLDMGLYDARRPGGLWGEREFRGWGGSSHPDVTITPEGFSSEEEYRERPRGHVPGKTTRGFKPGPIPGGEWAVELGVAAVATQGDSDGQVAWRVEIELRRDRAFADEPHRAAAYDERPARAEPGWYAGDMHVHAEHSSLGDATMTETFEYAFRPPGEGGAGLDFVTLSDYVTDSGWGEIGHYQGRHPGKLVVRSSEVITYRGHLNNHASLRYVDYRTGPVFELRRNGELALRRRDRPPSDLFDLVHGSGGWTQVNHPTIFPSEIPTFANLCRGCPWDYSDAETAWEKVDAYEVSTGPAALQGSGGTLGPNPFTLTAIQEWDRLRDERYPVTAVASSDSHNAGRTTNPVTQSPIGVGTTVVYADELSEEGIRRGVVAGHAYVKLLGADSPDLRLDAEGAGGQRAMMGDALPAGEARFEASVTGGAPNVPRELLVLRDGDVIQTMPVTGPSFTHTFSASQPGEYRIQVQRGTVVDALSNPIGLGVVRREKPPVTERGDDAEQRIGLTVTPRRTRAGRRTRFVFHAYTGASRTPVQGARITFGERRARTNARGRATIVRRFRRSGTYRARASHAGMRRGTATVVVAAARSRPRFTG